MADKCKSCGAEIVWGITEKGKSIPLDATPEQRFIALADLLPYKLRLVPTYQTHFVTCPYAKEHRKK